jgi:hypothetical protein
VVLLKSDLDITGDIGATATQGPGIAQVLCHLRNPGNLLNYMILSAWLKFMGIAAHIPSVSIG